MYADNNIEPICGNCLYCAPFNEDGWCEINNVPVSNDGTCDNFTSLEL